MSLTSCGLDVIAFVQESKCSSENFSFPKLVVSDDKITIFQDDVSMKTFRYGNICSHNSKDVVLESLAESITKDAVESIHQIMFLYKLSGNNTPHAVNMMTFTSFVLHKMYATIYSEKNCVDSSLHVSCTEVNNEGIIDVMQKYYTASNDVKVFEFANQTVNNVTERIITNAGDIDKTVASIFPKTMPNSCLDCHHTVVFSTIIRKIRNFDGFEVVKTGRFILNMLKCYSVKVDLGGCINFLREISNYVRSRRESFCLIPAASPSTKDPKFGNCSLNGILKNFLPNSKMSIMMTLPSTLFDFEHVNALEIISEMQNLTLKPAINEKLILRESLKDYGDEIKALEKDLLVLKNNNGTVVSQQKYRSLKNRLLLSETQLKDLQGERNAISDNLTNKNETLLRLQQEIKLTSMKIDEEMRKFKFSKITSEETEQQKIDLNLKKMEKVDACVSMNNLINSNVKHVKNKNSHLKKMLYAYEKSSSSTKALNENINYHILNATAEQNKLKDKIESLLLHLKEILLNSTIQQNNFILSTNEFYRKFEEILKLWKQHCTERIVDFHGFLQEILQNCLSLRNNLGSELASLNFTEGAIIELIKKNKDETLHLKTSCSTKLNISVENSIKLLYDVLCFLEIIQGKMKEQLQKLESTICCHGKERIKFLSSTNSTMESMHHYFNVHLDLSSKINTDIFSHHQELKLSVNQEFEKIKEALGSLKKMFCMHQTFVIEKWQQRQTYLSNVKEIGGVSESLQLCTEEHPVLLDKLRQQCVSSIDELYSILRDQTLTVDNLGCQLKKIFNEIESSIKECSEENKRRVSHQENDIRRKLEIQNEAIGKCMKSSTSMVESTTQCVTERLQNARNSLLNIKDLKRNNDVTCIILELRSNLNDYIREYANVLELNELSLQHLPEAVPKQSENLEESIEFNHEELLSSTPSSSHERFKNLTNDKTKFLSRLKQISSIQVNSASQSNFKLDQESIKNASIMSLPSMSTGTKVDVQASRSLIHRKNMR